MIKFIFMLFIFTGCTCNLIITCNHGANDSVDAEPVTETKTDADLSIPSV